MPTSPLTRKITISATRHTVKVTMMLPSSSPSSSVYSTSTPPMSPSPSSSGDRTVQADVFDDSNNSLDSTMSTLTDTSSQLTRGNLLVLQKQLGGRTEKDGVEEVLKAEEEEEEERDTEMEGLLSLRERYLKGEGQEKGGDKSGKSSFVRQDEHTSINVPPSPKASTNTDKDKKATDANHETLRQRFIRDGEEKANMGKETGTGAGKSYLHPHPHPNPHPLTLPSSSSSSHLPAAPKNENGTEREALLNAYWTRFTHLPQKEKDVIYKAYARNMAVGMNAKQEQCRGDANSEQEEGREAKNEQEEEEEREKFRMDLRERFARLLDDDQGDGSKGQSSGPSTLIGRISSPPSTVVVAGSPALSVPVPTSAFAHTSILTSNTLPVTNEPKPKYNVEIRGQTGSRSLVHTRWVDDNGEGDVWLDVALESLREERGRR